MLMQFVTSERGAVTVDWTVLTGGTVGLGLATMAVVSGGAEDLAWDIRNYLAGIEISREFGDLIDQVCASAGVPDGTDGMTYDGMPVNALLIYQESDFIGGLPIESGAVGGGGGSHTLELSDSAQPIVLMVADNDDSLHEVDSSQVVAQDVTLNGDVYSAGFDVSAAYTMTDSGTGMMVSPMHFGDPWSGHWQGPVIATAASNPLEPGESYTFDGNQTTHHNEMSYSAYLGCG